jgi:hypothetical protein
MHRKISTSEHYYGEEEQQVGILMGEAEGIEEDDDELRDQFYEGPAEGSGGKSNDHGRKYMGKPKPPRLTKNMYVFPVL